MKPTARHRRQYARESVAARQLGLATPTIERTAEVYQQLIRDGWNTFWRRRHRWLLLTNDAALILQAREHTRSAIVDDVRRNRASTDYGRLYRLILKHFDDEDMLIAIACAFAIEHARRGGHHGRT